MAPKSLKRSAPATELPATPMEPPITREELADCLAVSVEGTRETLAAVQNDIIHEIHTGFADLRGEMRLIVREELAVVAELREDIKVLLIRVLYYCVCRGPEF